jgi:phenylacetate-CoA ligase
MALSAWLLRKIVTPAWAVYERSPYLRLVDTFRHNEALSADERLAGQWKKLTILLARAELHSPYYRELFRNHGISSRDVRSWSDFARLPILTKDAIREHRDRLVRDDTPLERLTPGRTSGSTGVALHFFTKEDEFQPKRAVEVYRDQWSGWRLGEWRAALWGVPNPHSHRGLRARVRGRMLDRCVMLNTLLIDEPSLARFANEVFRRRPTLLFGHAHSLYLLAVHWRQAKLPSYRFSGVISTAMVLHEFERRMIEHTFGVRVFDRYGCEEVGLIASECEAHEGLHVNTDTLVVEMLGSQRAECRLLVTDLCNYAMPLIRYDIGDMGVPGPKTCPCTRTYPLLARVAGRVADYLRRPDGVWVSGISLTDNFATLIPGIVQMQIVQDSPSHLSLRIVKDQDYGADGERLIRQQVSERFGEAMRVTLEYVDRIGPEPSGKYRFSKYLLDDPMQE